MERAELERWVLATGVAEKHGGRVFLCDPHWTPAQRAEFGRIAAQSKTDKPEPEILSGWLCIATGGSSGGLRFARHDERTLGAAVSGFCAHFQASRINAVGVLPLHHVSGLMALVRCRQTGGEYRAWSWKQLEAGELPMLSAGDWFLSLVPTQLQRLLDVPTARAWLKRLRTIFIGGGPAWPDLLDRAAAAGLPVALGYGMTETAAMIASQTPEEFAQGDRSSGRVLPHAKVTIGTETDGAGLPADKVGTVTIEGASVFRGYFPEQRATTPFTTDDLGWLDEQGRLHLAGRRDAVIITGGKKVQPAEVEAALRNTGKFADVAVIGLPDADWGEIVVACHPAGPAVSMAELRLETLQPFQRPKRLIALEIWPRNAQGKVNRTELRRLVSALLNPRG
jgi:O-succinylbenzoic acid--CoA ligase